MESRCGAWPVDDDPDASAIEFRLFFPAGAATHIAGIRVAGTFQSALGGTDWDFGTGVALDHDDTDPRGTFWWGRTAQVPKGFYEYDYQVTFDDTPATQRVVGDPCARYGGLVDHHAAVVVGGSSALDNRVPALPGGRRPITDLIVYELMIDDFTADFRLGRAPLDAVVDKLDTLAAQGFTTILFLPWTAWGDSEFNWGYEPGQYFALAPRYAHVAGQPHESLSRLKALVRECHRRGIHVLMDGVFNHSGPSFPYPDFYLDRADCPFTAKSFGGAFGGSLVDLDFFSPCTNDFVLDVCRYWISTFGIDGIRFDAAAWYVEPADPQQGLPALLTRLQDWLTARGETDFALMLEFLDVSAARFTNSTPANSFWDDALRHVATAGLAAGRVGPDLLVALDDRFWLSDPVAEAPTVYLSNHDHSQIAWSVAATDPDAGVTGQWWLLQPWVIALYTGSGVPLVPNGQEYGSDHYLPENDNRTGRRVISRPLQWKLATDPIGRQLAALHSRLAAIRNSRPELRGPQLFPSQWPAGRTHRDDDGFGIDVDDQVVVFRRGDPSAGGGIVVVLNFSRSDRDVAISGLADGEWQDLLAGPGGFGDPWTAAVVGGHLAVPVGSNWGRVLARTP